MRGPGGGETTNVEGRLEPSVSRVRRKEKKKCILDCLLSFALHSQL